MVTGFGRAFSCVALGACLLTSSCVSRPEATNSGVQDETDGGVSDFYTWRGAVRDGPGKLLRREELPPAFWLPGSAKAERILYTSTSGVDGATPIVASGALFTPSGPPPEGGWPIVSWGHGTVGVADMCVPSWAGRPWRDVEYLSAWISEGFAIVASDYEGLGTPGRHPYLLTRSAGQPLLDAARAVVGDHSEFRNQVVLVGQSQGGGAVVTAAALAADYAPDLNVIGTVATGAGVIDIKTAQTLAEMSGPEGEPDPTTAYALYLALGLEILPEPVVPEEVLSARALRLLDQAKVRCIDGLEYDAYMAGMRWANSVGPEGWDAIAKNQVGLNAPSAGYRAPVFLGSGSTDIDVTLPAQTALADKMCRAGASVQHHVYEGLDHSGAVNASLKDSVPFVRQLMAGQTPINTCKPVSE